MKKNNFFLSFIILFFMNMGFISHTIAQKMPPVWTTENFDNGKTGFHIGKGKTIDYECIDAKYQINNHSGSDSYSWVNKGIATTEGKDFVVESDFTWTEGTHEGTSQGLVILAKDNKTYFFRINPKKGTFQVRYYQNKFGDVTTETAFDHIKKGLNESNKMQIWTTPEKISVKINGKEVYSGNNPKDFTANYGFFTSNTQKVSIDNFVFYHDIKINLVPNAPTSLAKENLGIKINTKYAETAPYIAPDGKTLYYSTQNSPENTGGEKDGDEIWYSESNDGGETWQPKKNMGKPLNNQDPNSVISSTPDNNTLLVANKYKADGSPNGGGFSITHRTAEGWEVPKDLDMENFVSKSYNEFCLSADRKVIVMAVLRDECIGGKDLFVSFNLGGNKWSKPKHMGNVINTKEGETSPFIAADGVSLYFSTAGLPGYGSNDIFVSRRLDDTWTNWSEPQNLGKGINSEAWEAYFTLPASGKYAYMASNQDGIDGSLDIVRIKLTQTLKPKPVVLISGKVYDSKTKKPLSANITYNILKNRKELGIATSNPTDGSYQIVLPAGEFYGFLAQKENFISVSENIDASKVTEYKEIKRDLYLSPIEQGQTIRLNNVFFDFSKATLRAESFGDLDRLVEVLKNNQTMSIEIAGHTDNVGTPQANQLLSQSRSQSVVDYLGQKGIAKTRLIAKGYGLSKPTATNATEEGRQLNRRVEVIILTK